MLAQKEGGLSMELRQIRYYIEVVDQGSFTQAAEACFISQSAISQQVKALEEELGLPLLLRQGRSFSLTPAGDYFYRKAKAWQGGLEDIVRETQRRADWGERVLRVGFACNYAGRELYQAIAAFAQQCPQTVVQVVTGTHEELYDLLRFDGVDVKINEQRRAFSQAYENLPLAYRPTVAEVCAHGGLRGRTSLSLEEARALPSILVTSPQQEEHERDYYHTTLGFGARFLSAPTLEAARLLVAANRGILPLEGVEPGHSEDGTAWRVPLLQNGQPLRRLYCAIWKKENTHPSLPLFAELLQTAFSSQG